MCTDLRELINDRITVDVRQRSLGDPRLHRGQITIIIESVQLIGQDYQCSRVPTEQSMVIVTWVGSCHSPRFTTTKIEPRASIQWYLILPLAQLVVAGQRRPIDLSFGGKEG